MHFIFHLEFDLLRLITILRCILLLLSFSDLGQSLVQQLIDLCKHFRTDLGTENKTYPQQDEGISEEPRNLKLVLILPRIFIRVEQFEDYLGNSYQHVNCGTEGENYCKFLHHI